LDRALLRYFTIINPITAIIITKATAPIAIPTFAPVDSELPEMLLEALESGDELPDERLEEEEEEVVVVAGDPVDEVDEIVVVDVGELVDTMAPKPFNTIPRFSAQQGGSLSQQKLPSAHTATLGRKPVLGAGGSQLATPSIWQARPLLTVMAYLCAALAPGIISAGRHNDLIILATEFIRVAEIGRLTTDSRSRTLRVVRICASVPIIAVDLAGELVCLCSDQQETRQEDGYCAGREHFHRQR
jgi:hypothetical protein